MPVNVPLFLKSLNVLILTAPLKRHNASIQSTKNIDWRIKVAAK